MNRVLGKKKKKRQFRDQIVVKFPFQRNRSEGEVLCSTQLPLGFSCAKKAVKPWSVRAELISRVSIGKGSKEFSKWRQNNKEQCWRLRHLWYIWYKSLTFLTGTGCRRNVGVFERGWEVQPWKKGRAKKQTQSAPQDKSVLGDPEWEKQDRKNSLVPPVWLRQWLKQEDL